MSTYQSMFGSAIKKWKEKRERRKRQKNSETTPPPMDVDDSSTEPRQPLGGIPQASPIVSQEWDLASASRQHSIVITGASEDILAQSPTPLTTIEPYQSLGVTHQATPVENQESNMASAPSEPSISNRTCEASPSVPTEPTITGMGEEARSEPYRAPRSSAHPNIQTPRAMGQRAIDTELSDIGHSTQKRTISPLWRNAVEKLRREKLDSFEETRETEVQLAQALIGEVEKIHKKVDEEKLHYRNSTGEKVYYGEVLLTQLQKIVVIGDIAIQHHPDVVALVWSGFRLLLQVGAAHYQNMAMISSALGYLSWVIRCGEIYERLYLESQQGSAGLSECLVDQYVSMLKYLLCAKQHLQKSAAARITESLSTKLARLLEDVRESEKRTRESADLAEKEAAFISRSNERTSISKLRGHLSDLRKEMKAIETAVDDCNTNLKRLCEYVEETKRKNALDWISKTEYGLIHDEHSTRRTPGTCNWLQENSQFDDWLNRRSSPVFWLRGAAGTGKTILCSKVIDLLKELYAGKHALAYFYCSTTTPDRSQPASVLRAIVRQLCLAYSKEGLPASLLKIYERRTLESAGLMQLEESKNLIIEISKHLPGVWIFIDALDECDLEERKNLLVILKNILGTVETVRMFLTSRFEPDIILHMESYSGHEIRQHDNSNDIRLYVESELRRLYDLNAGAAVRRLKDREGSILALSEDADGMFLPICLRMQALGRETGAGGMDHALNHTPNGLNNMYMDIIKRIEKNPTESRLAFNTIHWLFNTIDDCSPSIVLQALQIDTKINPELKSVEIETNEIPGICHGLVVHDDKTGIFRFSHATVREFLEQGATSCGPMDQRSVGQYSLMRRHEGEAWVANVCWEALLSTDYGDEEVYKSESPQYSLLKYSARNWGHHLRPLLLRSPDVARRLQGFLNGSSKEFQGWASQVGNLLPGLRAKEDLIISPLWVACYYRLFDTFITLLQTFSPDCVNLAGRTPLHHSAENGYLEFVQHLLCLKSLNANCTDDMRYTPLILAIESDQIDVVEALVTRHDLDVNVADECGRTALMHASSGGRHTILKHLIATKLCDPNIKDNEGLTALHQAIANGHELVVESLLKLVPNIELNCTDSSGKTPLWIAAIAGHQDMVRRLLDDRRVDINVRCLNSETLLIWAAKQNQGWLVRSLLERDDLRINEEGLYGWSALACAAWYGSLDALQWILKAHGVDIEHPDQDGDTPLMLATTRGNIEVIHTLLEIKPNGPQEHGAATLAQSRLLNGANINASRNEGLTALHLSAHDGHIEALQALLSHGADISAVTSQGFTALHLSAHDGHTEALQVLLSHGADISAVTNQGFTALHLSAQDGHTEALQALLSHGADISAATNQGSTALHLSAQNGHTEALQVLLSHGADIGAATNQGSTALHLSAQDDHTEALQVLLSHGADISAVTNQGFTALHLSAKNGHTETLEALLSHGADISAATNQGLTALHLSAKNGHTETLQALLSHGADISAATNQGLTALHLSAKNGHTETLQALLSHGADISAATNQGSTALHLSAKNGHTETLRALLSHGADNSAITNDGWTALHLAAQNGHTGTLQVLLSRGADISAAQNDGLTALHLAAQNGHTETLQVLLSHGANATLADKTGWTALHSATSEGSVLSVTMLLEIPSVDWRLPSHHGTTPLLSAAEDGYVEIFEMLLARYDEADKLQEVDNDGDTPLLCAAISGKRRIVELVLGRGGHDINHQDKLGLTALICAARGGHAGVVELLLKEDGIDVSIVEKGGKSAFDVAKDGGYEEVMALLAPSVDQTVM